MHYNLNHSLNKNAQHLLHFKVIIYHDFLPPPRRGHVKSDNTHAHSHQDTSLVHILDTWALIFSSCAPFTVYPNRIPPLHVITTRAREGGPKEHSAKQKWPRETYSVTCVPGLSTLSDLSRIVAQPPPSFLCCRRPPSHHPSSLISVSLVLVLLWLRPSTPFWPYGTHPFFPHSTLRHFRKIQPFCSFANCITILNVLGLKLLIASQK